MPNCFAIARCDLPCSCNILMAMSSSIEIMMLLIMKNISVNLVAHFSTVGVVQFCIVGNTCANTLTEHDMRPEFKLPIFLCVPLFLSNSAMSEGLIEGVYSGYMGRSQVSEAIKLLANAKYPVVKYIQKYSKPPSSIISLRIRTSGKYTKSLTLSGNKIVTTMKSIAIPHIANKTIILEYSVHNNSYITWTVRSGQVRSGQVRSGQVR